MLFATAVGASAVAFGGPAGALAILTLSAGFSAWETLKDILLGWLVKRGGNPDASLLSFWVRHPFTSCGRLLQMAALSSLAFDLRVPAFFAVAFALACGFCVFLAFPSAHSYATLRRALGPRPYDEAWFTVFWLPHVILSATTVASALLIH